MQSPLYLDTARFGSILPECAEMLREFATLLESEGQFPHFDQFLRNGSVSWPDRLTTRFPVLSQWRGLPYLRQQIVTLCGLTVPATVLFASASRNLARVAFQLLGQRCERLLCSDTDWPDFQDLLRKHLAHSGGSLHTVTLKDPFFLEERRNEDLVAAAYTRQRCDGALITAVSAEGTAIRVDSLLQKIAQPGSTGYLVVDGSQQVGHLPIRLGPLFNGIYLAGTHKWLRSGVPMCFAVITHEPGVADPSLPIRKAIRLCQTDDSLLLQTADVGLDCPRQTTRLEPLIAASLAVENAHRSRVEDLLEVRRRNALHLFEIVSNLQLDLETSAKDGIVTLLLGNLEFTADELQHQFCQEGVTLSARGERQLRISCPAVEFTEREIRHLWGVFGRLAERYCAHL